MPNNSWMTTLKQGLARCAVSLGWSPDVRLGELYVGQRLSLDGAQFVRCTFRDCILVYRAQRPFFFSRCVFSADNQFVFEGSAALMAGLLQAWFADPAMRFFWCQGFGLDPQRLEEALPYLVPDRVLAPLAAQPTAATRPGSGGRA